MRQFFSNWLFKLIFVSGIIIACTGGLTKQVYAGCQGTIFCGQDVSGCYCSLSHSTVCYNAGGNCAAGLGTCSWNCGTVCNTSLGGLPCSAYTDQASCQNATAGNSCLYHCNPVAQSCTWVGGCIPGSCVTSGSCYSVAGQCVRDGWNGCSSCFDDCTPAQAGCSNQPCPSGCGYGGGTVNDGGVNGSCGCTTKSCPATASCATPTPAPTPTPPPPGSSQYFDLTGGGGYPGIPAHKGNTNLNQANVSETGWLAQSGYNAAKTYNSAYFLNAVPEGTTINSSSASINVASLFNGSAQKDTATGIYWWEYDPASNGGSDLIINNPGGTSLGNNKVVIIVKGSNVTITGNINLNKGAGFFLLVAGDNGSGTKGNIIVSPTVGFDPAVVNENTPPNLEGIFIADGEYRTGTKSTSSDLQLRVRGSIATYRGMGLQRDLEAANSTTPAEFFEFAPDQVLLFPGSLGARTMSWQEVAP